MNFTERERMLISDGLIELISNAGQAKKLVCDADAQESIDKYIKELQTLNSKVCMDPTR